jgi:hypothetical protein
LTLLIGWSSRFEVAKLHRYTSWGRCSRISAQVRASGAPGASEDLQTLVHSRAAAPGRVARNNRLDLLAVVGDH